MSDDDREQSEADRDEAFHQLASWCLALLTMRANTPAGEWFDEAFQKVYNDGWEEAVDALGEDDANESALLDMMNMAEHLLDWLSRVTEKPPSEWLALLREVYVDPQRRA